MKIVDLKVCDDLYCLVNIESRQNSHNKRFISHQIVVRTQSYLSSTFPKESQTTCILILRGRLHVKG